MSKSTKKPSSPPAGVRRPVRGNPNLRYVVICILLVASLVYLPALIALACGAKLALLFITPDGLILSGKSGSLVYQKNGVRRINTPPANTSTVYRQFVKSTLGDFSSLWRGLTQTQQNSWLNAEGFTTKNRVGKFNPTKGKRLYTKLNFNLTVIGVADISDAPAPVAVPAPAINVQPIADESASTLSAVPTNTDAALGVVFEATPVLSFGSNSPGRNKFREFWALSDSTSVLITSAALYARYETRFGTLAVGDTFFIKASYISNVTGQQSADSNVWKVVVEA